MRERPIPFSGPMVRAILDGRKTQTRRIVNPGLPPCQTEPDAMYPYGQGWRYSGVDYPADGVCETCPYGVPGDRLWVRETWAPFDEEAFRDRDRAHVFYRADDPVRYDCDGPWRPSIHMPRWASRITLEVTEVRVQRVQEISEEDAKAEGAVRYVAGHGFISEGDLLVEPGYWSDTLFRNGFSVLWEEINGKRAPWESNPWVWAVTFRRC